MDHRLEFPSQRSRHRAHFSAADDTKIHFSDRNHLGGSSANKDLISNIQLVAADRFLYHAVIQVSASTMIASRVIPSNIAPVCGV